MSTCWEEVNLSNNGGDGKQGFFESICAGHSSCSKQARSQVDLGTGTNRFKDHYELSFTERNEGNEGGIIDLFRVSFGTVGTALRAVRRRLLEKVHCSKNNAYGRHRVPSLPWYC